MRIAPSAACCLILLGLVGCSTRPTESAAVPTAASTATASGPVELREGSKVKVALVPGGAHPYFQPWKEAARQSAADFHLGGVVFNETAEWDQAKQNNLLDSLAAQGYNAFGVFGVSPTDINTTFGDLKSKGFAVASLASCPAGDTNEADFCLSTDVEVAAYKAAKAAIDAMGGKGVLVHLTGNNVDANTQRRIKGVDKAVEETSGAVKLLPVVADVDKDLQTAQKAVADLLAARGKEIGGIVSTAYNPAVAAAAGVKKAGLPIKVVAIDDDPEILRAIREGSAYATIAQNPRGQAYVGSWALALLQSQQCTMRQPGVVIDSGSFLVTKENVDGYDTERRKTSEQIKQRFAAELLSCR
ncbi:substrate-binding domain-containing protein [Nonomuraea sp. SMC257]|uniref:Substrate-binding domain-containing protein n=1 Tax=Nonomuraea montanisoli TaxID=2741721 RepID=A0A7Y6M2N6_9ACTN|nr:substrate-binding domain-containing protein [Nonomuraea montanisoli]